MTTSFIQTAFDSAELNDGRLFDVFTLYSEFYGANTPSGKGITYKAERWNQLVILINEQFVSALDLIFIASKLTYNSRNKAYRELFAAYSAEGHRLARFSDDDLENGTSARTVKTMSNLGGQVTHLSTSVVNLQTDLAKESSERKAKDAELEAKDAELEAKNAELEAKDAELEAKNAELEAKYDEHEAIITNLQITSARESSEYKALNAKHEAIITNLQTALAKESSEHKAKNAELEATVFELRSAISQQDGRNKILEDCLIQQAERSKILEDRSTQIGSALNRIANGLEAIPSTLAHEYIKPVVRRVLSAKLTEMVVDAAEQSAKRLIQPVAVGLREAAAAI